MMAHAILFQHMKARKDITSVRENVWDLFSMYETILMIHDNELMLGSTCRTSPIGLTPYKSV